MKFRDSLGNLARHARGDEWPEFTASNVGFVLSTPEQKGESGFSPSFAVALRVPDVGASMERLRAGGVEPAFPEAGFRIER